jgi:hypothetical protein
MTNLQRFLVSLFLNSSVDRVIELAHEIKANIKRTRPNFFIELLSGGDAEITDAIYQELSARVEIDSSVLLTQRRYNDIISHIAMIRVLMPRGRPLVLSQIQKFFEDPALLQEFAIGYNSQREEFMKEQRGLLSRLIGFRREEIADVPPVREIDLANLSIEDVEEVVMKMLEFEKVRYQSTPLLSRGQLSDIKEIIVENIKNRVSGLDYGAKTLSKLKTKVKKARIERAYQVREEHEIEERESA